MILGRFKKVLRLDGRTQGTPLQRMGYVQQRIGFVQHRVDYVQNQEQGMTL